MHNANIDFFKIKETKYLKNLEIFMTKEMGKSRKISGVLNYFIQDRQCTYTKYRHKRIKHTLL